MATFGYTVAGTSGTTNCRNDVIGTQFAIPEAGVVTHIDAHMRIPTPVADGLSFAKAGIYDASNNFVAGTPGTYIDKGFTFTWYRFTFGSPVYLAAGTYWLVVHQANDVDAINFSYDTDSSVVGGAQLEAGPGFPSTYVPGTDSDKKHSIYATYEPVPPVAWLTA
jgi:hypothetical protein